MAHTTTEGARAHTRYHRNEMGFMLFVLTIVNRTFPYGPPNQFKTHKKAIYIYIYDEMHIKQSKIIQ